MGRLPWLDSLKPISFRSRGVPAYCCQQGQALFRSASTALRAQTIMILNRGLRTTNQLGANAVVKLREVAAIY